QLATPLTRLVVVRQAEDGPRWVLAHDRMAEAVEQLVDEEGRQGQLIIDSELLALRRFVTLRTALYRSQQIVASRAGRGEQESATRVPRRHFRRIDDHAAALLWDEARRGWFEACHQRRREDRRRLTGFGTLALLVLALIGWGAWAWANRLAQQRALREQVVEGKPDTAFLALDRLSTQPNADIVELLGLVRKRDVPMDVLEGLGGLDEVGHSAAVLRAVEMALPWIEEDPQNSVLLANMLWALDFTPSRDPDSTERALVLRDRVLAPLRQLRPPPLPPEPGDLEWITVPFGSFLMGLGPGEPGNDRERPQHEVSVSAFRLQRHEVTNGEYRRLVPDHPRTDGDDELPVASVNWYEAYTYAAWLGGRLPTEAEWEYAARAGCPYAYCDREGLETTVEAVAWTVRNSSDVSTWVLAPRPVMRLEANPWGFYDMLGNMAEWVADGYQDYPDSRQSDPWSPITPGRTGVLRGGMFFNPSDWSRVTHRSRAPLGFAHVFTGFRSVLPRAPDLQREERRDQRP
ncbi:MAG: SUMF1/EgtB/PvdO family nonheme iron enzyme, partial [Acidobacteriota bacterium]